MEHSLAFFIEFDRHTLQQSPLQNLGIGSGQIRFVQKWTHFEDCSHLCLESGLNLATRLLFTSIIQYTNVMVGLKLLAGYWDKRDMQQCFVSREKNQIRFKNASDGDVPTHVVTLTHVGTSVYLGQTHLGTPLHIPAWVKKFSLGSTGDEISSLIIIQGLFVQQKFEY